MMKLKTRVWVEEEAKRERSSGERIRRVGSL